ncbi:MAG: purine-nucleoside phosphorylase, partial [Alphaproteobacteria bacterium]|nr:purine-nucleoside phosphorylase [Alphaproteobacteria bacterium]
MLKGSFEYIKEKIGDLTPDTAVILGSGLGGLVESLTDAIIIPYKDIPNFPQTTVAGHSGCF